MLITEPGLTWTRAYSADDVNGGTYTEYRCVEHPRLTRLVQRPNDSEPYCESYHVRGLVNYYHTPAQALAAMRANPEPAREPV